MGQGFVSAGTANLESCEGMRDAHKGTKGALACAQTESSSQAFSMQQYLGDLNDVLPGQALVVGA